MITPNLDDEDVSCLNLGLCQVYTEEWAVEDNLHRVLVSLEQARDGGAELAHVLEPEVDLTRVQDLVAEGGLLELLVVESAAALASVVADPT